MRKKRVAKTQALQHINGIRRELDAGADRLKLGRLLNDDGAEAFLCEGQSGGQTADTATGNQNGAR
jgi:hypothetical protein